MNQLPDMIKISQEFSMNKYNGETTINRTVHILFCDRSASVDAVMTKIAKCKEVLETLY